jgi:hypothetical protein
VEKKKNQIIFIVIVYSHTLSPRLQYIIHFLSHYFQHPFKLTASEQMYATSADFKINYSYQKIADDELYIAPHALLFETEKRHVQVKCFEHSNGYKAFFETSCELHFDLFAAIFFLLSRYEEYLPHKKDRFGLYAHENSIAFEEGFLHQPLVNIWLEDFRKKLEEKFEGLSFPKNNFSFIPTYDIDIAWAYKYRGFKLYVGNVLQSFFKGKWHAARARIRTVKGKQQDPYDTYEWMNELHQKFNLHPIYFFLVAETKGKYDKNTSITVPQFQELIKDISARYDMGVHPSWYSGDYPVFIQKQKQWLENISGKQITKSRQHYLRFNLPQTFQRLISTGIKDEYSMGYGSINGFRASIASSFYWYDLEKEETTSLLLHPFCFMDANSFFEQKFTSHQGLEEILGYYKLIKEVNGTMIILWHNNILGTGEEFAGWREVYEQFIEKIWSESL